MVQIQIQFKVVSDKMTVTLLEPGVANMETIGYGEFQNSLTFSWIGFV